LLFSNPNSKERRENMTVRVSYDDGQTWLLSRIVREGESAYSDLVIQDSGAIGLLYEHGNDDGIHFAHFKYEWLINGRNHTDNQFVKKIISSEDAYAKEFQFALAPPSIESKSVFFDKTNNVRLMLELKDVRIHYTLDGANPSEQSPLFSDKIILTKSATLKAKAFHPQCLPSEIVEAKFIKLGQSFPIKNITLNKMPNEKYQGKGAKGLVDRKKGTTNFRTSEWMGFSGGDVETIIEFDKKTKIQKVTASMLADQGSWIFLPKAIEVYCSKNGNDFRLMTTKEIEPIKENEPLGLHFLDVKFAKEETKFLKIVLKAILAIPDWHPGKGTPAWLFVDEILIE